MRKIFSSAPLLGIVDKECSRYKKTGRLKIAKRNVRRKCETHSVTNILSDSSLFDKITNLSLISFLSFFAVVPLVPISFTLKGIFSFIHYQHLYAYFHCKGEIFSYLLIWNRNGAHTNTLISICRCGWFLKKGVVGCFEISGYCSERFFDGSLEKF